MDNKEDVTFWLECLYNCLWQGITPEEENLDNYIMALEDALVLVRQQDE